MFLPLLQICFLLLVPLLYLGVGVSVVGVGSRVLSRWLPGSNEGEVPAWSHSHLIVLGLLFSITTSFLLWHAGLPLVISTLVPFLILVPYTREVSQSIREIRIRPHLNLFLWSVTVFVLGISIFEVTDGIQTPWTNNYGDLTFHLGMITSFVFGENRLPEYHLYAGEALSYPIFINFWTASLWSISPIFKSLPLIFQFQWIFIWILTYNFLKGDRYWLLPWAVLLGGGSYMHLGENSGQLIPQNIPWTTFITTVWVPQRSALFGVLTLTGALSLFHDALKFKNISKLLLLRSGLIFGLSPLVHTHFFLAGVLYVGGTLGLRALTKSKNDKEWRENASLVLTFALPLLTVLISLPWILGKKGIVSWSNGWITDTSIPQGDRLIACLSTWFSGSTSLAWIVSLVVLWIVSKRHFQLLTCIVLVIAGNFVQLAVWEWDQLKLFLGLYIVSLSIWSSLEDRKSFFAHFVTLLLLFPACYEIRKVFLENQSYTIYTKDEVKIALDVRSHTSPKDIVVGAPNHNSLLTLTGRRMFYGYEGTLSSHGIDYGERQKMMGDLNRLAQCSVEYLFPDSCPTALLWTDRDKEYWKVDAPGEGFYQVPGVPLYRVIGKR